MSVLCGVPDVPAAASSQPLPLGPEQNRNLLERLYMAAAMEGLNPVVCLTATRTDQNVANVGGGAPAPDMFFHGSPETVSMGSVAHAQVPSLRYSSCSYSSLLLSQGTNLSSRACMHRMHVQHGAYLEGTAKDNQHYALSWRKRFSGWHMH